MPFTWKPIPVPSQAELDTWGIPGVMAFPETDETDPGGPNKLTWLRAQVPLHPQAKFGTAWEEDDYTGDYGSDPFHAWRESMTGPRQGGATADNPIFIDQQRREDLAQHKLDLWNLMQNPPPDQEAMAPPVEVDVAEAKPKKKTKQTGIGSMWQDNQNAMLQALMGG